MTKSIDRTLKKWSDLLACPACLGALHEEAETVVCTACGRVYPVVDGIPVLIAERDQAASSTR
jgi:uncharacterized protein YbaR (Trm112 family)